MPVQVAEILLGPGSPGWSPRIMAQVRQLRDTTACPAAIRDVRHAVSLSRPRRPIEASWQWTAAIMERAGSRSGRDPVRAILVPTRSTPRCRPRSLARTVGTPLDAEVDELHVSAALLHDIGKVGLSARSSPTRFQQDRRLRADLSRWTADGLSGRGTTRICRRHGALLGARRCASAVAPAGDRCDTRLPAVSRAGPTCKRIENDFGGKAFHARSSSSASPICVSPTCRGDESLGGDRRPIIREETVRAALGCSKRPEFLLVDG